MTRILPGVIAMAAIVVASNILVQFLFGNWLTWGAFIYPLSFLVTDVMNRVYGSDAARKVVFVGFIAGIVCSLIGSQIMIEVAPEVLVPAVALRIAIGSAIAFLVAQLLDVAIFNRLRNGAWWRAPLASTLVGSTVDTALFFSIAFAGSITVFGTAANEAVAWAGGAVAFLGVGAEAPLWVSLAVADWVVKTTIALIALVPFRLLVGKMMANAA